MSGSASRWRKRADPKPDAERAREGGIDRGGRSIADAPGMCNAAEDDDRRRSAPGEPYGENLGPSPCPDDCLRCSRMGPGTGVFE